MHQTTVNLDENALNNIVFSSKSHFEPMGILKMEQDGAEKPYWCAESSAYGDSAAGKPGKKDVDEAVRLLNIIRFKFPNRTVSWRSINEFVQVLVF